MSIRFGDIRQSAFVVKDIDNAMAYWSGVLGIGPFFVMRRFQFLEYRYGGLEMDSPVVSIALAFSGDQQIELIEQHDAVPSVYVDPEGRPKIGFHHLSSWLTREDYDARYKKLQSDGVQVLQDGLLKGSGIRLSYWATQQGGHDVIFEMSDTGDQKHLGRIRRVQQASRDWSGKDPVREVRV